jgi:EmrB/QacA subfamily drug resistance transporter
MTNLETSKRWWALLILCLGSLMIVLDTTIVNIALPSIRADLGFTETTLVWVVNAYMLTFSGFLLLGGRLGDLFGHRKMFLLGIIIFTLASLLCGTAHTQALLIIARAVQGFGGAIVTAVALSLIVTIFTEASDRAKAMGFFGFVSAGGGAIGVFLGGLLTGTLDWHWVFLVNLPIGIAVFLSSLFILPAKEDGGVKPKLDILGALLVTSSLMLAVYAVIGGNSVGWLSFQTISLLLGAAILFSFFILLEKRVSSPLVPLHIFKERNVIGACGIGVLWSAAMFTWFFISALYLQLILGYTPMQVGLSFLPGNLLMAAFSLGLSAKVVLHFGTKKPLAVGMLSIALGLVLFALSPIEARFLVHVLPGMILLGLGAGLAFNPVLLIAMNAIAPEESGLASGVLNTAFMMGGSLGLAVLASFAAARTGTLLSNGVTQQLALLGGYHGAFWIGGLFAFCAAIVAFLVLKEHSDSSEAHLG